MTKDAFRMTPQPPTKSGAIRPRISGAARNIAAGAIACVGISIIALLMWGVTEAPVDERSAHRAVIVDQLAALAPSSFQHDAEELLRRAGYEVDYYGGDDVTVDAFRTLPAGGYNLVILRMHSGLLMQPDGRNATDQLTLFTRERYGPDKYRHEQADGSLATYDSVDGAFFAITPTFVATEMDGSLGDATVVLMGCHGVAHDSMARALLDRDAGAVVGWDDFVLETHTDATTLTLLRELAAGADVAKAAGLASRIGGRDPVYGARLSVVYEE